MSTVCLLSDDELRDFGVQTVGERARLRKMCRESIKSKHTEMQVVLVNNVFVLPLDIYGDTVPFYNFSCLCRQGKQNKCYNSNPF